MCNIGIVLENAGGRMFKSPCKGILLLNSNKSECNICRKAAKAKEKCRSRGIFLEHDVIVCKGPDRDINRDAINMLILKLISGQYEVVVVEKLSDLTNDISDLHEFMKDAAPIGVCFYELSSKCFYCCDNRCSPDKTQSVWDGGYGC